jgi:hypothetical protein
VDDLARRLTLVEKKIRHRQVIPIVVGVGMDSECLLEIGLPFGDFAGLDVELTEVVVGVVVPGLELRGFSELFGGQLGLARARQRGAQVDAGFSEFGLDLHGRLEVLNGLVVSGLRDVDHSQELVEFIAARRVREKLFQFAGSLGVAARLVVRYCGLVLAIEVFFWRGLGEDRHAQQEDKD